MSVCLRDGYCPWGQDCILLNPQINLIYLVTIGEVVGVPFQCKSPLPWPLHTLRTATAAPVPPPLLGPIPSLPARIASEVVKIEVPGGRAEGPVLPFPWGRTRPCPRDDDHPGSGARPTTPPPLLFCPPP
jgi:hypothetical protein